jgi:transcriptional regulator with XRE-family HTH domain
MGKTLLELRKHKGFGVKDVGEYIGRSSAYVARFEAGTYPVDGDELVKLMDLYGVSDLEDRSKLLRLAQEVTKRGWWEGYLTDTTFADYVWAESNAHTIDAFVLATVHGLLQTPDFARTILEAGPQRADEKQVSRFLEARVMRSQLLQSDNPPQARFLLHESTLRQDWMGSAIIAAQLRHILSVAEFPNVRIRVLPVASWAHIAAGVGTGFTTLEMRDSWPTLVYVDTPIGAVVAETPDIDSFTETYDALWNGDALDEQRTVEWIETRLKDVT